MARQSLRRLVCLFFLLCGAAWAYRSVAEDRSATRPPLPGEVARSSLPAANKDILRISQNVPGDFKPIVLHADAISSWTEGPQRVVLLKGRVLVEHGVSRIRMGEGVAWVDQEQAKQTGVVHLDLYAEGDVEFENGSTGQHGKKAWIDLHTRGELKLKAQGGKVPERSQTDDPLYQRAATERAAQLTPAASVQPATHQQNVERPTQGGERGTRSGSQSSYPSAVPPSPPPPAMPQLPLPALPAPPAPAGPPPPPQPARQIRVVPRRGADFQVQEVPLAAGEKAYVVTGGIILTVSNPAADIQMLDLEADRLVIWSRGDTRQIFNRMRTPEGEGGREVEFYLAGNVELREQRGKETHTLRADEIYYDVGRNVAVAYQADLEFRQPKLPDVVHLKADELLQVGPGQFQAARAEVFSSRLPSDPGLKVFVTEATLEEKRVPKRSIFGRQVVDRRTGEPQFEVERLFEGNRVFLEVEDVPVVYLPYVQGDAEDPLGPLKAFSIGYSKMFGTKASASFNAYDLFGIDPVPGTRWKTDIDYLSKRGPALGTDFDYAGDSFYDVPGRYVGFAKAWGIWDEGVDVLGGNRGLQLAHPDGRGRILLRHHHELPDDFTLQFQTAILSDKNFLEQYYYNEFNRDINQETFVYLKQQRDNWAWTVLVEPRIRNWVNETERLPQVDGYLLGQSFFDVFTYNAHASAGYDRLRTSRELPPPSGLTTFDKSAARFDLWQDLSLPFDLGPFRVAPYGVVDLTQYTNDRNGDEQGRFYGGGGVRAALPLSRLYPDISSELFNVNGIHHKIVLSSNFYSAHSETPFTRLPQFDRLQDDATDQSVRDMHTIHPALYPGVGTLLVSSPLYDPQVYAIRRLVDNRVDTLDSIEVLQVDLRQRWQTKRGFPGMQHIIDWMTLDLSASYFPQSGRDNFSDPFAFLEYDWTWNVGDRTALVSDGWFDPIDNGARVFSVGAFLNRPDRTSFYLGYRQTDPLQSRLLTGSASYVFSPKYAVTAMGSYDLGTDQGLSSGLVLTRMGSDLQVSLGVNYNAILNNFGFTFEILPNVAVRESRRLYAGPALGR